MSSLEDVDLNEVPEQPQEEEQSQEVSKEEKQPTIEDYLKQFPDAPDSQQLESWKQKHGEVFCAGFSDSELFIFRAITRAEFTNLQTLVQQSKGGVSDFEVQQKIVTTCVLWASDAGQFALEGKAGTFTTLHEQVLLSSNFMDPRVAGDMVIRL